MRSLLVASLLLALAPTALAHGGPGRSPDLAPGQSWNYFADDVRVIAYHCHQHPTMGGELTISPQGPRMANITIQDFAFSPAKATVRYGGVVNWSNQGAVAHSVEENTTQHETHASASGGNAPPIGLAATAVAIVGVVWARRRG